jgi:hypothetical protein
VTDEIEAPVDLDCAVCLCDEDTEATYECNEDCWALIACVQLACDGDADATQCIIDECSDDVGGSTNLMAVGALSSAVPFGDCEVECPAPGTDGGIDPDTDAGN